MQLAYWDYWAQMKQFPNSTKPFCAFDANALKPLPCNGAANQCAEWRASDQTGGRAMFNLDALKLNSRTAAAFAAVGIGAVAFSASAAATPLPLFPFIMTPPLQ